MGGIDHVLVRHEQGRCIWPMVWRARPGKSASCWNVGSRGDQCDYRYCHRLYGFIPLVVLSGQVATSLIGYDAFRSATWWGFLARWLNTVFWLANGRHSAGAEKGFLAGGKWSPGPVVVDLPKDILNPANKLPTSGRSRSVCDLTIPRPPDIRTN